MAEARRMRFEDLSRVAAIQCSAYRHEYWEHPSTFLRKWVSHPKGCWVGKVQGRVMGYAFTHPWTTTAPPPPLNAPEAVMLPALPNCLYIHDVAVDPATRGSGLSRLLFAEVTAHAAALALPTLALVAVGDAGPFWAKLGFSDQMSALGPSTRSYILKNYGSEARYMTADVALCTNQPRGSSSGSSGSVVAPNSEKDSFVQTKPHRALDFSLPPSVKADVVVVGAGLSGLRAASLLKRLGYSVLVLEASERVGGRLKPFVDSDGITWDVGGQWVGPQQHRMHKLLQEYAIGTVSQYDDSQGKLVIVNEGERIEYDAGSGVYPEAFSACLAELDRLAASLPPEDTLLADPFARKWDEVSVAAWTRNAFPEALGINPGHTGARGILASEENEVSMLYWLRYIRNARGANGEPGMHDNLSLTKGGAQQDKIQGSAWSVASRIHRSELHAEVRFHAPVTHVYDHQSEAESLGLEGPSGGVSVVTADGSVHCARAAVIAMPLPLSGRLSLLPPRPTRARAAAGSPMASVIKVLIEYHRDFWKSRGFSGLTISDAGPVALTYDATVGDTGSPHCRPHLVAFVLGRDARLWSAQPAHHRRDAILDALSHLFQSDEAKQPRHFVEQDWCNEAWIGGGYVAVSGPGILTNYGQALTERKGVVTWCGADISTVWQGYMEGAIFSAELAVAETNRVLSGAQSKL